MSEANKEGPWAKYLLLFVLLFIFFNVVMPDVPYCRRSDQSKKALREIAALEKALARSMEDAEADSFREFFDTKAFGEEARALGVAENLSLFEATTHLYSQAAYLIVREGDNAVSALEIPSPLHPPLSRVLDASRLKMLTGPYLDIEEDPWGTLYNVYPGPWPDGAGPIPFRVYLNESGHLAPDLFTVQATVWEGAERLGKGTPTKVNVGYPAPRRVSFYIWSNGENIVSNQPMPPSEVGYANSPRSYYDPDVEDEYLGGGDDINNWDEGKSWEVFYE